MFGLWGLEWANKEEEVVVAGADWVWVCVAQYLSRTYLLLRQLEGQLHLARILGHRSVGETYRGKNILGLVKHSQEREREREGEREGE